MDFCSTTAGGKVVLEGWVIIRAVLTGAMLGSLDSAIRSDEHGAVEQCVPVVSIIDSCKYFCQWFQSPVG